MTVYYHITTNLEHEGRFYPRIPKHRIEQEESTTPRVCVAPTIEDCLTGIPDGGYGLRTLLNNNNNKIKVFRIDTHKLGIQNQDVLPSVHLFREGLVPDAATTNETWIKVAFNVPQEDTFIIEIDNYKEKLKPVVPYHVYKLSQMDWAYKGDIERCHLLYHGKGLQGVVAIHDLKYRKEGN